MLCYEQALAIHAAAAAEAKAAAPQQTSTSALGSDLIDDDA
jgi:hypothetical protein